MGPPWSFLVQNEYYVILGRVVAQIFEVELVQILRCAQQPVLNLYSTNRRARMKVKTTYNTTYRFLQSCFVLIVFKQ